MVLFSQPNSLGHSGPGGPYEEPHAGTKGLPNELVNEGRVGRGDRTGRDHRGRFGFGRSGKVVR